MLGHHALQSIRRTVTVKAFARDQEDTVGGMIPENNDINFCLTVEFCRAKTEIEGILPNQDSQLQFAQMQIGAEKSTDKPNYQRN